MHPTCAALAEYVPRHMPNSLLQAQLGELGRERNKLNLEKAELENTLEAEQEFIANRLQMQVNCLGRL